MWVNLILFETSFNTCCFDFGKKHPMILITNIPLFFKLRSLASKQDDHGSNSLDIVEMRN